MDRLESGERRMLQLGVVVFGIGTAALVGLRLQAGPDMSPSDDAGAPEDRTPHTATPTSAGTARLPSRPEGADPEPADDIPRAAQPLEGEAWALLRVPLVCQIEPQLAGPPVVGEAAPTTWPGADHAPQPGGLDYPAVPMRVTVEAGELTGTTFLPVADTGGDPVRHVVQLELPGFAPTDFSFVTTGPDQPARCEGPVQLVAAASGVVGVVRFQDGSPAAGAVVDGCGTRATAGSDGDYFLLPRAQESCTLRARHAPGTSAESAPRQVEPLAPEDQILDFIVEQPEQPDPGVEIFRTDDGEVWARPEGRVPWSKKLLSGARILRVGDMPADELSDEELLMAMVHLGQAVHVQQYFETEDGQGVRSNTAVTEL